MDAFEYFLKQEDFWMTPSIRSELHRITINKSESEVSDSAKASLTVEQKLIDGPEVASGSDTEEEDKKEEDKKRGRQT